MSDEIDMRRPMRAETRAFHERERLIESLVHEKQARALQEVCLNAAWASNEHYKRALKAIAGRNPPGNDRLDQMIAQDALDTSPPEDS